MQCTNVQIKLERFLLCYQTSDICLAYVNQSGSNTLVQIVSHGFKLSFFADNVSPLNSKMAGLFSSTLGGINLHIDKIHLKYFIWQIISCLVSLFLCLLVVVPSGQASSVHREAEDRWDLCSRAQVQL